MAARAGGQAVGRGRAMRSQVLCVWGEGRPAGEGAPSPGHGLALPVDGAPSPFAAVYDWRALTGHGTPPDWRVLAAMTAERHPGCDLLVIEAGADAPDGWSGLLARGYEADDRVGAICPLTDALAWLSPFDGARPDWMGVAQVMHWLQTLSRDQCFDIPALWPDCLLLRAETLPAIAAFERPLADPAPALQAAGWAMVACDWLFVAGGAGPSGRAAAPLPLEPARLAAFAGAYPLGRLRHAFGEAGPRGPAGLLPARPMLKPVQLHVAHSWGGGLERWLRDYSDCDTSRWNLVLRSIGTWGAFGQKFALHRDPFSPQPLREWVLQSPIASIAATHVEYRRLLREIIDDFGVDAVLVSSMVGHALDVLDTGLPTLWVAHDYVPFCPALVIYHDGVCRRCGRAELERCERENPHHRFFKDGGPDHWLTLRQRFLALVRRERVQWVAPSESVGRHYRELAPALRDKPLTVIAHGVDPQPAWQALRDRERDAIPVERRLRLVVLGSLAPQKGQALLRQAIASLAQIADVHLLGCGEDGEAFRAHAASVTPRYTQAELPALLAGIDPDAGLLLSTVPETFSYTLSELWQAGIVPVATRLGSFADRIRDGVDGFLFDPGADSLVGLVRELDRERARLIAARAAAAELSSRSRADMVADYHRLLPLTGRPGIPPPLVAAAPPPQQAPRALHIDPNARFVDVLREFLDYAIAKVEHSPRLARQGGLPRRVLRWPLRRLRRILG